MVSRATVAAGHAEFVRSIGSTDTVVAERRNMDEIKASGQWSNVTFSNKCAFTHNYSNTERQWFRGHLAVADPIVPDVTVVGRQPPLVVGR